MVNKVSIRDVKFAQQSVSMNAAALQNEKPFSTLVPGCSAALAQGICNHCTERQNVLPCRKMLRTHLELWTSEGRMQLLKLTKEHIV